MQTSGYICAYMAELGYYFRSSVLIPSLCAAIPHASVLTFSGTMLTYLLNAGYSLKIITAAKVSGAVFDTSSTFIFPWAVGSLCAPKHMPSWYSRRDYHEVEQREPSSGSDRRPGHTDDNHAQGSESGPVIERSVVKVDYWALSGLLLSLVNMTAPQFPQTSSKINANGITPRSPPSSALFLSMQASILQQVASPAPVILPQYFISSIPSSSSSPSPYRFSFAGLTTFALPS